jgi:putative PIN family toxin of toxin-antitoxin system
MVAVVLDTNVVVAALRSPGGASRRVVRGCLADAYEPLFGAALLAEYEYAVVSTGLPDWQDFLDSLTSVGRWVNVYYQWRPNLRDESDNHLVELALAGGAAAVVTHNVRDLRSGELLFPSLRILTPAAFLMEFPCPP